MAAEKRIAVLMTCYNRAGTTLECLKRLFAQSMPEGHSLDVWLVDDASPDGTGEKVKAAYPQVNVIRGSGNLFWCKGMRLAWDSAAAAHDYDGYLWLNDDVMLVDGALEGLVADWKETGESAILVGAMDDGNGNTAYGIGGEGGKISPKGRPYAAKGAMSGNFVFVPRNVYRKIGPIYGGYSHGYGDYDYGWLADRHGIVRYLCSMTMGTCPQQLERYRQQLKGVSLAQRLKTLFDRKGFSIKDNFVYKYRNFGMIAAVASVFHVLWIRVVLARER